MTEKPVGKTGLVYISHIPPHMKSHKLRYILNQFGNVKRMYLRKEPIWKYKKRLEKGDRKGRLFEEGWAEFEYKVHAKKCAEALNGKPIGLRGRWQYDIMTIKYLHGFKWKDLEKALEEKRKENTENVSEETKKARQAAKQFLKHTKASIAGGKKMSKEHKAILDDEDGVFSDGTTQHNDNSSDDDDEE